MENNVEAQQKNALFENLDASPLSDQLLTAILRESAAHAERTQRKTAHTTAIVLVESICGAALKRKADDLNFIDQLADTLVYALFGTAVPPETKDIIDNMRNTAHERRRQQQDEAHARELECKRAGAPTLAQNNNAFSPQSVTIDGQANIGGGTISREVAV